MYEHHIHDTGLPNKAKQNFQARKIAKIR